MSHERLNHAQRNSSLNHMGNKCMAKVVNSQSNKACAGERNRRLLEAGVYPTSNVLRPAQPLKALQCTVAIPHSYSAPLCLIEIFNILVCTRIRLECLN